MEPVGEYPNPANGAKIGNRTPVLQWSPREKGVTYDLYFGSNFGRVRNAHVSDASGVYRGRLSEASYETEELNLGWTYYWRVDEVESNGWTITKGDVWSFTIVSTMTVEIEVSSSNDDGYVSNEDLQNLSSEYLKVGFSKFASVPYYRCGMVFRNVTVPRGAEIVSALLKIRSHDNHLTDIVYGIIEAEMTDDADGFGGSHRIGSIPTTGASVNWDHFDPWSENTWYESPDIASVVREAIESRGWLTGNSIAILYSTRQPEGGYRNFSSFDRGSDSAPKLEITYTP
jgi:hypothetical protein